MKKERKIYVDFNEVKNVPFFSCFKEENLPLDFRIGDWEIERKTGKDFVDSVLNDHLFEQLKTCLSDKIALIVEGPPEFFNIDKFKLFHLKWSALQIDPEKSISHPVAPIVLFSRSEEDTARILLSLEDFEYFPARSEWSEPKMKGKRKKSQDERKNLFLTGLPGISLGRAKKILKDYLTPWNFFKSLKDESFILKGIGDRTIQSVKEVLF